MHRLPPFACTLCSLSLLAMADRARAQQPAPAQPPVEYPPPGYYPPPYARIAGPDPTAHVHDGLYLRMSIGIGYLHDKVAYDEAVVPDVTFSGAAVSSEMLVGGTPVRGLVFGGGLIATSAPSAKVTFSGAAVSRESLVQLMWAGGFCDWYPNPREGFHLQALLGVAGLSYDDFNASRSVTHMATGVGLGAAIGHEWWVASQWSIGVIGRLMYMHLYQGDTVTVQTLSSVRYLGETHSVITPAVLFGATYH